MLVVQQCDPNYLCQAGSVIHARIGFVTSGFVSDWVRYPMLIIQTTGDVSDL